MASMILTNRPMLSYSNLVVALPTVCVKILLATSYVKVDTGPSPVWLLINLLCLKVLLVTDHVAVVVVKVTGDGIAAAADRAFERYIVTDNPAQDIVNKSLVVDQKVKVRRVRQTTHTIIPVTGYVTVCISYFSYTKNTMSETVIYTK